MEDEAVDHDPFPPKADHRPAQRKPVLWSQEARGLVPGAPALELLHVVLIHPPERAVGENEQHQPSLEKGRSDDVPIAERVE